MKRFKLLIIALIVVIVPLLLTTCYAPSDNEPIINGNGIIKGKVFDNNGIGISGVTVSCEGKQTVTSPEGEFILKNVPAGSRRLVNFTKDDYASNQKLLTIVDYKQSYTEAAMFPIGIVKNVSANASFNIAVNGASVNFQSNSLVDTKGNQFSGQATIKLTYFDPFVSKFFDAFPGEFIGVENSGTEVPIESYGFIDVEMYGGSEKLQLADGKPATVSMPIPAKLLANAPLTIPLWNYDTKKGKWLEIGTATKNGNKYEGTVTHFSKINLDMKYEELCQVTGKIVDQNGDSLPGAWIRLSGEDFAGGGAGSADETGSFEFLRVKANASIKLVAYYSGFYSNPLILTTAGNGQTTDAGKLVITIDPNMVSGWSEIGNLSMTAINDMQFLDANTGWIVADGIYRTDDGGVNWVQQLEGGGGQDSGSFRAIQMLDANNGWAGGSKLYFTNDGGTSWNEKDINNGKMLNIMDVFFLDANYGWLVGYGKSFRTTNGGTTWETLPDSNQSGEGHYMTKIYFVDANNGYALTYGKVQKTSDGGMTWTEITLPGTRYGNGSLYFSDINTGWVIISGEKDNTKVYFTSDGGVNFTDQTPVNASGLNDVFFISAQEGWIAGSAGSIYHTVDAGATWNYQFNKTNGNFKRIFFIDNKIGWAAGYKTSNVPLLIYTDTGGVPQ